MNYMEIANSTWALVAIFGLISTLFGMGYIVSNYGEQLAEIYQKQGKDDSNKG